LDNYLTGSGGEDEHHLPKKSLKRAIALIAVIFFVEVAGGLVSVSLSLLGDAAHVLQDVVALIISLGAIIMAGWLPTPMRTFGYHRVEIGAAVVNGFFLIGVSGVIVYEALARFSSPARSTVRS